MIKSYQVTVEHINQGRKWSMTHGPIVLALQDKITNDRLWTLAGSVLIHVGANEFVIKLPTHARDFLRNFDNGKPVQPFTLELNVPDFIA